MAESKKGDGKKEGGSSVIGKKKDAFDDLDFGNDFLASWNSKSTAKGDGLDFDFTAAPKGNKKQFAFDKMDMDFGLDGDFGKISSFNMDMSDLDISPQLKEDGKPKKSKDSSTGKETGSSFNVDMSDLDISLPHRKDGTSMEKPKESSSGKNKGKKDRFAFPFDFDEMDSFSFDPEKEGSEAQKDKNKKESSTDESDIQDEDDSVHANVIGSLITKQDEPQKPSLPETQITSDKDSLVGGSADLEPTSKILHSESAMNDDVTTEHEAAIDEVVFYEEKIPLKTTIVCEELPNNGQSIESVSPGPVDFESCTGNDAMQGLSSDYTSDNEPNLDYSSEAQNMVDLMHTNAAGSSYPSNNEPSGSYLSEAQNKIDSVHTNATGSNGEQDANMMSVSGSICNDKHTLSENSHHQSVSISENTNNEKSQDRLEDHVIYDRGKTELGKINALLKDPCTTSAVSERPCDSPSGMENLKPASEIHKLPLISKPADLSKKPIENRIQPLVDSSQPFLRPEKPECPLLKVSMQTPLSSLSSTKAGSARPSLVEGRSDMNTIQCDKRLGSLSLQHSKTPLRGELPQIQSQENCTRVKICGEIGSADRLQNRNKMNDTSEKQMKDMIKTKPATRQRDLSMKDLDTLREIGSADGLQNGNKMNDNSETQIKDMIKTKPAMRQRDLSMKDLDTLREIGSADGIQNGNEMNDNSETQTKDMIKTKPATGQRNLSMKDLDTLSMDINKRAAKNCENPTTSASIPTVKNNHVEECRNSSTEGGKGTPDLTGLKLTSLSLDAVKYPLQKDSKSVGNSSQKSVLLRKTPSDIARIPGIQKQTSSTLSQKRTLEDNAANNLALHPSKRLSQSSSTSRNLMETSGKVLYKKAPSPNQMELGRTKSTIGNREVTEVHIPHKMKNKRMELSFSIQNDSNIKLADAYSKELDDLCNILRKRHDEAKEILARAIVNSNKQLMLNNPQFKERIRATQDLFARLTINSTRG